MSDIRLRAMEQKDRSAVAELICNSTNAWYKARNGPTIFPRGSESCLLFCDVYEDLDPGCCVIAEDHANGRIAGSCFYHPRETHVSLGIMNAHPDCFGQGVARRLLQFILNIAAGQSKPVRLVSSAMNLDSFSLYTRAGFTPRQAYQDMFVRVPAAGLTIAHPLSSRVRPARPEDAAAMADLEMELNGVRREKDYRYFTENRRGIWHASVLENPRGTLDGFLVSVNHPASNMLGPGAARGDADAAALILAELNHHAGRSPVFLVPVDRPGLVKQMYDWGARNCELHFHQVLGAWNPLGGVNMPTFMPETA